MASKSWLSLLTALAALLCIGIVVGTIAIALIPVYLEYKGNGIDVNTNTNSQVYTLGYVTNSKETTSFSIDSLTALSVKLNQALGLNELVILSAKYTSPTKSNRKKRATTECADGRNTTNGLFQTGFQIDYSKVCHTQACQQKLIEKVISHITILFPSIDLPVNLPNGTSISFALSYCWLLPAVSTTTTQKTTVAETTNQANTTSLSTTTTTTTTSATSTSTTTTTTTTSVPLCSNGKQDQDETAIDCGGAICTQRCAIDQACAINSDCSNGNCHKTLKTCQEPSCSDGNLNNGETDVDCGGTQTPACPRCDADLHCTANSDCDSTTCLSSKVCDTCFSGDETVILADGSTKSLKDTQVGEFIWTMSYDATEMYLSEVMMIVNTRPNWTALFYTIETESNHRLSLTPDHYIRVEHFDYLPAEQLTLNHSLFVVMNDASIQSSRIRTISQEFKTGVYNLFTLRGTLLVNQIAASTYINNGFGTHHTKHRIYTPMRIGYHLSKHFEFLHKIYVTNEYGTHWIVNKFIEYRAVIVSIDQIIMLLTNFLSIEFLAFAFGIIYIHTAKKRSY